MSYGTGISHCRVVCVLPHRIDVWDRPGTFGSAFALNGGACEAGTIAAELLDRDPGSFVIADVVDGFTLFDVLDSLMNSTPWKVAAIKAGRRRGSRYDSRAPGCPVVFAGAREVPYDPRWEVATAPTAPHSVLREKKPVTATKKKKKKGRRRSSSSSKTRRGSSKEGKHSSSSSSLSSSSTSPESKVRHTPENRRRYLSDAAERRANKRVSLPRGWQPLPLPNVQDAADGEETKYPSGSSPGERQRRLSRGVEGPPSGPTILFV